MIPFPTAVDNTMVSTWRACPQKFWLAYMRGLAPTEESIHLLAGGAFAKGIEVTRKRYWDDGLPFHDAVAYGGGALLAAYGATETHTAKTALNLLGALGHYFETWPIDQGLVPYRPDPTGPYDIECRIAVPIPGTVHPATGDPLIYGGRFDQRSIYRDSMIVGLDEKTSTSLGGEWLDRWRFNSQILGYAWGSKMLGVKLGGFMIRGISLLKNSYGTSESLQMIPEWKLEKFEDNLRSTIGRMVEDWQRQKWDYNMGATCNSYGGCPFIPLCDSHDPESWIKANFYVREWNPLSSRD